MILPIFSSTFSLGRSLFTLEAPEELDISAPISIFTVAQHNKFNKILLADDNMTGFFSAYQQSLKSNIQLCFGLNFKIINDIKIFDQSESIVTVWMKNGKGYEDLLKLNHFANTQGYRHPHAYIDWKTLNELTTSNLAVTIPFYSSFLAHNLLNLGQNCLPKIEDFNPIFLVHDQGLPFDKQLGDVVRHFVKQNYYDIKDAHSIYYYNDNHSESLQVLRCIGERSTFEKPELSHFGSDQFSVESYIRKGGDWSDSFFDDFKPYIIPKLSNGVRLPEIQITKEEKEKLGLDESCDNYKYLSHLVGLGLKEKVLNDPKKKDQFDDYVARCKTELDILRKLYFVDYILLVAQVLNYAKDNDIPVGAGRGSSAGSLVAYLTNIVHIDPLEHNLYFSRFISEARAKSQIIDGTVYLSSGLPDVDSDICYYNRDKVIKYVQQKYEGKSAKIITVSRLTGKIVIKEVCKAYLKYSEADAKRISSLIERIFGTVVDLQDAYNDSKQFKAWVDEREENKRCYEIARHLENLIKGTGVHASGIVISNGPVSEIVPLCRTVEGDDLVSSYDMGDVGNILIKLDLLGLKSLSILAESSKLVGIDWRTIDVHHPSIYEFLKTSTNYHGLFQIEKGLGKNTILNVKPDTIHDLAVCVAIGRPGAMKYIEDYVKYKRTGECISYHESIDKYLKRSGGIIVYQEQINDICQYAYKMSGEDADRVEYGIRKKKKDEMAKWEPVIYLKGEQLGISKEVTDKFWSTCVSSADYLFNASHAYSYSNLLAAMTYMKANHPLELFTALLKMALNEAKPIEEITPIQKELQFFDIRLLPPTFKESENDFKIQNRNIRFGLAAIKGISDAGINHLTAFNHTFAGKFDLFNNCEEAKLGLNVVSSLVYAGVFPDYGTSKSKLLLDFQVYHLLKVRERLLVNQFAEQFNNDLFAILKYLSSNKDTDGKEYVKPSRFVTIKKDSANYQKIYEYNVKHGKLLSWLAETKYLGFAHSGNLVSIYKEEFPEVVTIYEALSSPVNSTHTIVGMVKNVKEGKSREKKTPYIKLELYDDCHMTNVMAFNDKMNHFYDEKNKLIQDDTLVVVTGKTMADDMIFADRATVLWETKIVTKANQIKETNHTEQS